MVRIGADGDRKSSDQAYGRRHFKSIILSVVAVVFLFNLSRYFTGFHSKPVKKPLVCQTFDKVEGASTESLKFILEDESFINGTMTKLQNIVRIPTEIQDEHPDPTYEKDAEMYKPFVQLHKQLAKDFPMIWSKLQVETVNEYSFIITWEGSESSLKPLMFAAHIDVVPVERQTWNDWKHAPFGGEVVHESNILESTLWGRGAFDDKNMIIGELQALELLLEQEFEPTRSIIVAIGFDEEVGGPYGAGHISQVLLERYGEDGIYAIVDEGVNGIKKQDGVYIASPATGEKGFINFWLDLLTPGGHSSVPPEHTSIGVMAEVVKAFESEKFPAYFSEKNPLSQWYQCVAQYSDEMDPSLQADFLNAMDDEEANTRVIKYLIEHGGRKMEYLLRTSQAIDIINGGFKSNALPETVSLLVNSRVAVESSVKETMHKFVREIIPIAEKFNLGLTFGDEVIREQTANGLFTLRVDIGKEPAMASPNNEVWRQFAGSIKSMYEDVVFPRVFEEDAPPLVIAPTIMSGNTDCMHYLSLTKNIYRYQPGFAHEDTLGTIHSVNEHVDFETVMDTVAFVYHYVNAVQSV